MNRKINLLDLFSGIGGFHLGLEQAGFEFDWVGFSEIDKYAKQTYKKNFSNSKDLGDVRAIQHQDLPKIDIITFGSPCQDFSIAGKRAGLDGNRSSLIGEAIRLITDCKPRFFIWENVKGTFSSNDGADFWAIIKAFTDIGGYRLEWQLLNTRWFLPQNRERIYLVGCIGEGSGQKIFPIEENGKSHIGSETGAKPKAELCTSITTREGGRKENNFVIVDKELKKKNNQAYAANLSGGGHSGGNHSDMDLIADFRNDEGLRIRKDGNSPTLAQAMRTGGQNVPITIQPVLTPNIKKKSQNGRRFKEDGEDMFTLTAQDQHGISINNAQIRRLTPTECERLQGFPDGWTEGQSDTQRYKQLGNAVTVNVVKAVGERIYKCQKNQAEKPS